MRKSEIETYYVHGRSYPSVNVKVYAPMSYAPMLPLELGGIADADGSNFRKVYTDERFTDEWIESRPEDELVSCWDWASEDGWEQAKEAAGEIFDGSVKVYGEGRSGGHLIVDGLSDVEDWDAIDVARWSRFVRRIEAIKADQTQRFLWNLYANIFEAEVTAGAE